MEVFLVSVLSLFALIWYINFMSKQFEKKKNNKLDLKFPKIEWVWNKFVLLEGFISLIQLRKDGMKMSNKLIAKYGNSFQIPLPLTKVIATADPVVIKKLLHSSNTGHLNKPRVIYDALFCDWLKDGLVVADVNIWSPHRKVISQALTYKSLRIYLNIMKEGAENAVMSALSLVKNNNENEGIPNSEMIKIIDFNAVKTISQIMVGSCKSIISDEETIKFHEDFTKYKELSLNRFLHPHQLIPAVWMFHPNKKLMDYHTSEVVKLSNKMSNHYRTLTKVEETNNQNIVEDAGQNFNNGSSEIGTQFEEEDDGVKPFKCMMEQMISSGLSNKEIADEVNMFLAAGHETTVRALDMLLFHLAGHPEIQEKCRLELDQLLCSKGTTEINDLKMEELSELHYLERCIFESMRITPTIPFVVRRLDVPLEIDEDLSIDIGYSILVNIWGLHRNSEIYENPEIFDPDRFLPENVKKRHAYAFIPFSMGARNCIGWKIAMLQIRIFAAWILKHFEMTTKDKLNDVKLTFDITLKPERLYDITFKKRVTT